MLTTGSKTLPIFADMLLPLPDVRLIARMLPRKDNMELCERLRFPQENIIAMQGPFTKQLDIALMQHFGVTLLVTKESGRVGFVDEKLLQPKNLALKRSLFAVRNFLILSFIMSFLTSFARWGK